MTKSRLYLDGILQLTMLEREKFLTSLPLARAEEFRKALAALPEKPPSLVADRLQLYKDRIITYLEKRGGTATLRRLTQDLNFHRVGPDMMRALTSLTVEKRVIQVGNGDKLDPKMVGLLT